MVRIGRKIFLVLFLPALSACEYLSPRTVVDVTYPLADGRELTAHYSSTKDIEAPSFIFERDPETQQVNRIVVGAGSSLASPVIEQNTQQLIGLGSAIGAGVATGLRTAAGAPPVGAPPQSAPTPRPGRFDPVSSDQVERLIWAVHVPDV